MKNCIKNLRKVHYNADYIILHCYPASVQAILVLGKIYKNCNKVLTFIQSHVTIKMPSKSGIHLKEMAYNEYNRRSDSKSEFTKN